MEVKKVVIVGGVGGGASAAARVRRLDEFAQITIFEKGPDVSFSNCALPYTFSDVIDQPDDVILKTPMQFEQQYNIDVQVNTTVVAIDAQAKTVMIKRQGQVATTIVPYDTLILSPGARPILPAVIAGIDRPNVKTVRNVQDVRTIQAYLTEQHVHDVTIVGGGFIGLEMAENLQQAGYQITIIEAAEHVLGTLDDEFAQLVHKELYDYGVQVILQEQVTAIGATQVQLASGRAVTSQLVIVAIGVTPVTELAVQAGCALGVTGGIKVDHRYQTSVADIYAVGDAIEVTNRLTRQSTRLALAFPAQMQARHMVDHLYGRTPQYQGVIGSQVLHIFTLNVASTGLNATECEHQQLDYRFATVAPQNRVSVMPGTTAVFLKLIFSYPTGEILGAQAIGQSDVDKPIDIIASLITMHGRVSDLTDVELCYSPWVSTAKNVVNMVGLVAENVLNDEFKQVAVTQVRQPVLAGAFIIDAREPQEYADGHIKGAHNIPLSQFRQRLVEIPTNQPVYIHCQTGQRSYNMVRALLQRGYTNVVNIAGSYAELVQYEYFNDQTTGRTSILTRT
ncbi:FAD-dependent oxidoreductase [Lactiplantibacillus plantarum]|uniref:FAD-dependent oxidoreductase n=1 Tax=Lactiplantibacillus plantarum TaxID=1590 RepID=UPI003C26C2F0